MEKYVPDTLDLVDRAELVLKHLDNIVDKKRGYLPYFDISLTSDPPMMRHSEWDSSHQTARFVMVCPLLREMTGTKTALMAERRLRENLLSYFSENDGLNYRPKDSFNQYHANMADQGIVLWALLNWYKSTKDVKIKEHMDKMCEALKNLVEKFLWPTSDIYHFPAYEYLPKSWDAMKSYHSADDAFTSGPSILPLVECFEITHNEVALQLAKGFVNHLIRYSGAFGKDGSFTGGGEFHLGHFHSRSWSAAAVLKYGVTFKDFECVEWARRVYEWAKTQGSSFGWFPEFFQARVFSADKEVCETCCITDMINMALMLANAGYDECWEDVDRWVRNQLVENQLTKTDWVKSDVRGMETPDITFERVAERAIGGFAGWSLPNDFVSDFYHQNTTMSCCTSWGGLALYLTWKNIITERNGQIYVNLLLNRESPWLEVSSYLPYEGKVELWILKECNVNVRLPSWVNKVLLHVHIDEKPFAPKWVKNFSYLALGKLRDEQKVEITFPMQFFKTREHVGGLEYELEWKGNTVVSISPKGRVHPLYQRKEMKENHAPIKKEMKAT